MGLCIAFGIIRSNNFCCSKLTNIELLLLGVMMNGTIKKYEIKKNTRFT